MAHYAASYTAAAGTNKTIGTVIATTAIRPRIYDIMIGATSTPADIASDIHVARFTAVGTAGSSVTPIALDPLSVAATATAGQAHSAEPTYAGVSLLSFGLYQRNTVRWVCSVEGGEIIATAAANNGIGVYTKASGATPTHSMTIHWRE